MISGPLPSSYRDKEALINVLTRPLPDEVVSQISGNAAHEVKEIVVRWHEVLTRGNSFGSTLPDRKVTEVSIVKNSLEPEKKEGIVVCEIEVTEDMPAMVDSAGAMHRGCIVYLIDECSTFALTALTFAEGGNGDTGVSQAINTVFHSPATVGARLKIVNTSVAFGSEMMSSRSEVWDTTNHQLVASGVHLKMSPSAPRARL